MSAGDVIVVSRPLLKYPERAWLCVGHRTHRAHLRGDPADRVVGQGRDLPLGVGLRGRPARIVVIVLPGPGVRVVRFSLAIQGIVPLGPGVALGVLQAQPTPEGVEGGRGDGGGAVPEAFHLLGRAGDTGRHRLAVGVGRDLTVGQVLGRGSGVVGQYGGGQAVRFVVLEGGRSNGLWGGVGVVRLRPCEDPAPGVLRGVDHDALDRGLPLESERESRGVQLRRRGFL